MSKACSKCKVEKELSSFQKKLRAKSGLQSQCKSCIREYYIANQDRQIANGRAWYENNKERKAATAKAWYKDNKEKVSADSKAWREDNKERTAATDKAWSAANPESKANSRNARRARMAGNGGNLTTSEWKMILASWLHSCASCGTKERLSLDHIIPISKGGQHSADNAQPLCVSCNSSKGVNAYSFLRSALQFKL